jgi:hypothetical protein
VGWVILAVNDEVFVILAIIVAQFAQNLQLRINLLVLFVVPIFLQLQSLVI